MTARLTAPDLMAPESDDSDSLRVLVLPATRRDGEVTRAVLEKAHLKCEVCTGVRHLAEEIARAVGVIVLTDTALSDSQAEFLVAALHTQPQWSDIPIVLLGRREMLPPGEERILKRLSNVTLLDRPTSMRTLLSAIQAALRTRSRQYQIRDQIVALCEAEDALRAADRRKDEFLAMLAHELRNPLSPILTASELLERTLPLDEQATATLGVVKRQVRQLTRLVDDLLDVSRITQNRIQLHRRPVEIATIVSQAVESVEPVLRQKRHNLLVATGPGPFYVDADSARLVQCLGNVLTNATKYTDAGGEIRLEVCEEPATVVISVADNGVGIPQELLPRIFDLFVQNDRSLDRSEGGLGIGLSVVKRLVEMHGGRVTACSAGPGCGSRFELRLPLIEPPRQSRSDSAVPRAASKRILIVDDNVDAATSLALLLAAEGHIVETVYTAAAALDRVATFGAEVICLDIGLPQMDGYELAAQLRQRGSKVVLIAVTGYGQADDIRRGRDAGFDAHLIKPVDLGSLNRILTLGAADAQRIL
jgi:two-component system, sensor histidine kinase